MPRLLLALLCGALPMGDLAAQSNDRDWPSFRHDAARSGRTVHALSVAQLALTWQRDFGRPLPAWPGPARWDAFAALPGLKSMREYDPVYHVVAAGDSLWFGSNRDHQIHALDASTGDARWHFQAKGAVRVAPNLADGRLFFGSDDGAAYCIDAQSGQQIWRHHPTEGQRLVLHNGNFISFWPIRTGVVVEDGLAYFGASFLPWKTSYLCAVNAQTGAPLGPGTYRKDLGIGWTLEGALLASEQSLVVPQGRVAPLVFSREDGSNQGTLEGGGGSFCLLTDDQRILHGPGNKTGWITDSESNSGAKVASYERGNAIVVDGQTAFLLSDRALTAFDRQTREVLWSRAVDTPFALIQAGNQLIAGGDGHVRIFNTKDGAEIWAAFVPARAYGLAVAQNRLFVSTDDGSISCFAVNEVLGSSGQSQQSAPQSGRPKPLPDLATTSLKAPPELPKSGLRGLQDHWIFQADTLAQVQLNPNDPRTVPRFPNLVKKGLMARPLGPVHLQQAGGLHALELDGTQGDLEIAELFVDPSRKGKKIPGTLKQGGTLPSKELTAEAWVRVDQAIEWGGIIGATIDNGEDERGWLLGFRQEHFGFAVKGQKGSSRLTWLKDPGTYQLGSWHHVAGTYDGKNQRLFVDGTLVAESTVQQGEIDYPDAGWYQLGAYRDQDEYFRMRGALHEVRLYKRALTEKSIREHFFSKVDLLPEPLTFQAEAQVPVVTLQIARGPWIRFLGDGQAEIRWESKQPMETAIEAAPYAEVPGPDGRLPSEPVSGWKTARPNWSWQGTPGLRTAHTVLISGIEPDSVSHFRIVSSQSDASGQSEANGPAKLNGQSGDGGQRLTSRAFELDSHFALSRPIDLRQQNPGLAWELCQASGNVSPLILLLGPDLQDRQAEFEAQHPFALVHYPDAEQLHLLPPACIDLLVVDPEIAAQVNDLTLLSLIAPGGLLYCAQPEVVQRSTAQQTFIAQHFAPQELNGVPNALRRSAFPGAADWSHLYGSPDNSAFSGETLAGASSTDDLEVQWVGRPGPRYQSDRQNRRPSPLASNGRLYLQGLNRIICMNSFNGSLLWSWELPNLQRFNMPRDCSNWCADPTAVYVAMQDQCFVFDGPSGMLKHRFDVLLPADADPRDGTNGANGANSTNGVNTTRNWDWGFVARAQDLLVGSSVRSGSGFTDWWGGANWYDARSGSATGKVCSEQLFALDASSGETRWTYRNGLILNTTITIADGKVFFCENRSADLAQQNERRIEGATLFENLHLVALDLQSGELVWQREAKPLPGEVAFWLAYGKLQQTSNGKQAPSGSGLLVMVSSKTEASVGEPGGEFAVYTFDPKDGSSVWRRKFTWEMDHHGKSLSRPTMVGGHLYLRPYVLSLADGEIIKSAFPAGHQCGTYVASENALFLRAGNLGVWDRQNWQASRWERLRPDCWISTIPANGMLLAPEGGGGCSCGSWLETSIGFMPRSIR